MARVSMDTRGMGLTVVGQRFGRRRPQARALVRSLDVGAGGTSGVTAPSDPETVVSAGLKEALIGAATGFITGGPAGAVAGGVAGLVAPPQETDQIPVALPGFPTAPTTRTCPPPTIFDPGRGICISPGSPADASIVDVTDAPSMGIFGLLSVEPIAVGEIRGRPILRCPLRGLVLGKDNRCYSKADLPKKLRKWPPKKRMGTTDRRLKAIKDAGSAAKALKKAFKGSGYKIVST